MEFPEYLDTRDLAKIASDAEAVLEDGDSTEEEQTDAQVTLDILQTGLNDLGYYGDNDSIEDAWIQVGDNIHVTLVREDIIGEYWEERAEEFGYITQEGMNFLGLGSVDWYRVAKNQKGVNLTFSVSSGESYEYWIY